MFLARPLFIKTFHQSLDGFWRLSINIYWHKTDTRGSDKSDIAFNRTVGFDCRFGRQRNVLSQPPKGRIAGKLRINRIRKQFAIFSY